MRQQPRHLKPEIPAAVAEAREGWAARFAIDADESCSRVACTAFIDPRRFVDDYGRPIPLHLLPDDAVAAVLAIEITVECGKMTYRLRLADRSAANDRLKRHMGLYDRDKLQVGNPIGERMSHIHGAGSRLPVSR